MVKHFLLFLLTLSFVSCEKKADANYNKHYYSKTQIFEPDDYDRPFQNKEAEKLFKDGVESYADKQFLKAENEYKKSLKIEPHPNTYNELGICLRATNRINESLESFQNAIKLDSTFSTAYFSLANLYAKMNDYKSAERITLMMINNANEKFWKSYGYLNLSAIYNNQKDINKAKIFLDSAKDLENIEEFRDLYRNLRDTINMNLNK